MCVSVGGHGSGHGVLFIYRGCVPVPVFLCGSVCLPLLTEITSKYPCECVYVHVCGWFVSPLSRVCCPQKVCLQYHPPPLLAIQLQSVCAQVWKQPLSLKQDFFFEHRCRSPVQLRGVMRLRSEVASSPQRRVKQSSVVLSFRSQTCGWGGWHHRQWRRLWCSTPAPRALQWPAENVVRLICLTFTCFDVSPANVRTSKKRITPVVLKGQFKKKGKIMMYL